MHYCVLGDIDSKRHGILLGADNQNVFSRVGNRIEKGISPRMAAAPPRVCCAKQGIEVYPPCRKSIRNIKPDFTDGDSERDIEQWAFEHHFAKIERRWRWNIVLRCAPRVEWVGDRILNLQKPKTFGDMSMFAPVAELGGGPIAVLRCESLNQLAWKSIHWEVATFLIIT